jgi:hypothetical protein
VFVATHEERAQPNQRFAYGKSITGLMQSSLRMRARASDSLAVGVRVVSDDVSHASHASVRLNTVAASASPPPSDSSDESLRSGIATGPSLWVSECVRGGGKFKRVM